MASTDPLLARQGLQTGRAETFISVIADVDDFERSKWELTLQGRGCCQRCCMRCSRCCWDSCLQPLLLLLMFCSAVQDCLVHLLRSCLPGCMEQVPAWASTLCETLADVVNVVTVLLPPLCYGAHCFWHWVDLPQQGEPKAQRIVNALLFYRWFGLLLVLLMALQQWQFAQVICAAYFSVGIALRMCSVWTGPVSRRLRKFYGLLIPMYIRYSLLNWWSKQIYMPEVESQGAFNKLHDHYAPLVFGTIVDLGGFFVKMGQKMSMFPIFPPQYANELKKLLAEVPPKPVDILKGQVSAEFRSRGVPEFAETFKEFDEKPLGTASIAQVHAAKLRDDTRVVVKVQHAGLRETLDTDLRILDIAIKAILGKQDGEKASSELKRSLMNEVDFELEARNLDRIHRNLAAEFPEILTPVPSMTVSGPMVLIMTCVPGVSLLTATLNMVKALAKACGMGNVTVEDIMKRVMDEDASQNDGTTRAQWKKLKSLVSLLDAILPESAKNKLVEKTMSTGRVAVRLGIGLYNETAGRFGFEKMEGVPSFDSQKVSERLWDVFGHMILVDGFFTGDPHPGNIHVSDDGRLGLIDFGQVVEISDAVRVRFCRLLVALEEGTEAEVLQAAAQLGYRTAKMTGKLVVFLARLHYGKDRFTPSAMKRVMQAKNEGDELTFEAFDPAVRHMSTAILLLKASAFILGVTSQYPSKAWLQRAKKVLADIGSEHPPGEHIAFQDMSPEVLAPEPKPAGSCPNLSSTDSGLLRFHSIAWEDDDESA